MRVLALTFGDASQASSFYRIYQYIEPLKQGGIKLEAFPAKPFQDWSRLSEFDAVLVQKKLFPLGKVVQLRRQSRRLIYDVDDAIWHPHGRPHFWFTTWRTELRLRAIARSADFCLAANQVLAEALRRCNAQVHVLPMALDQRAWPERSAVEGGHPVRIGWAGHPVNLPYLESIESALLPVQHQYPEVEFAVFCGQHPSFKQLRYQFIPYCTGAESEIIRTFDIGLLPLPAGKFAEAKSPIKGLQYMASGIPAVVSPLGATRQMFRAEETAFFAKTEKDWIDALTTLVRKKESRRQMGQQARRDFEEKYALSTTVEKFAQLLFANCRARNIS